MSKNVQERIKKELDMAVKKDPKYDLTNMQWQMKQNSEDVQSFIKDLNDWEKDIHHKDKNKNQRAKGKVSFCIQIDLECSPTPFSAIFHFYQLSFK